MSSLLCFIVLYVRCGCGLYYYIYSAADTGKVHALLSMMPTMIPKIPRADAKISTINTFTNKEESCASAIAQLDPAIPTDTPDAILVRPTESPAENIPNPA